MQKSYGNPGQGTTEPSRGACRSSGLQPLLLITKSTVLFRAKTQVESVADWRGGSLLGHVARCHLTIFACACCPGFPAEVISLRQNFFKEASARVKPLCVHACGWLAGRTCGFILTEMRSAHLLETGVIHLDSSFQIVHPCQWLAML